MSDPNEGDYPVHPNTLSGFSYVWSARVNDQRQMTDPQYQIKGSPPPSHFKCGGCGGDDTILLYEEHWGCNAGTNATYEINCKTCNLFTVIEKND